MALQLKPWRRRRDDRDTFCDVLDDQGRRVGRVFLNADGSYTPKGDLELSEDLAAELEAIALASAEAHPDDRDDDGPPTTPMPVRPKFDRIDIPEVSTEGGAAE